MKIDTLNHKILVLLAATFCTLCKELPIPVAARSKAWVHGRSLAGIAGSNPSGGMDVCLVCVLCVVRQRSLRLAEHSSRGVLPGVSVFECDPGTS